MKLAVLCECTSGSVILPVGSVVVALVIIFLLTTGVEGGVTRDENDSLRRLVGGVRGGVRCGV